MRVPQTGLWGTKEIKISKDIKTWSRPRKIGLSKRWRNAHSNHKLKLIYQEGEMAAIPPEERCRQSLLLGSQEMKKNSHKGKMNGSQDKTKRKILRLNKYIKLTTPRRAARESWETLAGLVASVATDHSWIETIITQEMTPWQRDQIQNQVSFKMSLTEVVAETDSLQTRVLAPINQTLRTLWPTRAQRLQDQGTLLKMTLNKFELSTENSQIS